MRGSSVSGQAAGASLPRRARESLRQRPRSFIPRRSVIRDRSRWLRPLGTTLLEARMALRRAFGPHLLAGVAGRRPTYHSVSGEGPPLKLPPRPRQPRRVGANEDLAVLPVPIPGCASGNLATMAFTNSSLQQQDAARLVNPEQVRCRLDASAHRTWSHPGRLARGAHGVARLPVPTTQPSTRLAEDLASGEWNRGRGAPASALGARCPISPGDSPQLISDGERLGSPQFLPSDLATVEPCRVFSFEVRRYEAPTSSSFCSISGECSSDSGMSGRVGNVWIRRAKFTA